MKVTSDLQVVFLTLDFLKSAFTPWAMLTLLEINVSTEVVFVFVQQYRSHTDLTWQLCQKDVPAQCKNDEGCHIHPAVLIAHRQSSAYMN